MEGKLCEKLKLRGHQAPSWVPPIKAHQRAITEQTSGRFEHTTAVESCPEPDEEISRWRTDFDEQVTYLDVVRNAKSFDKVIR